MTNWRPGLRPAFVAVLFATASGILPATAQEAREAGERQRPAVACGGEDIARGTVNRIIDGRTFRLDDGREVRLAAIEVPLPPARGSETPSGGAVARDALAALAQGDEVVLRSAENPSDRYQRIVAYAYALRDGEELFIQGEMISSGFARMGDRVGSRACAASLQAREMAAREAKLGLWADPYYDVLNAETPADVLAHRGRFALVEGKVESVRESGSTIYVNFGRRWSEGFTVTIQKRNERSFAAAGLDPNSLAGRRVRVRGWVEERGGRSDGPGDTAAGGVPSIEAAHPEQVEIAGRQ